LEEIALDADTFQSLSAAEVAAMVRAAGTKVCVFPINGTRRWFLLEHLPKAGEDPMSRYLNVVGQRHIELYQMLFDHGLDTLLAPVFGPDLSERGDDYMRIAAEGLARLATNSDFLEFYRTYRVRVRFYGDYRTFFGATPYAYLSDLFDETTSRTMQHDYCRLFFGVCAQEAVGITAELAVGYYIQHGHAPDKRTLIRLYYGEPVGSVDLFIGFDKLCVFDMPLLATGDEDLYFTVSPSPYLTERQLRGILYDHLFARRGGEPDLEAVGPDGWAWMKAFYQANSERTLGVGRRGPGGFWYPLPQVELPSEF